MAIGIINIKQENIKSDIKVGSALYYDTIYEKYKLATIKELTEKIDIVIVVKIIDVHTCLAKSTVGEIFFKCTTDCCKLPKNCKNLTLDSAGNFITNTKNETSIGYTIDNGFYFKITPPIVNKPIITKINNIISDVPLNLSTHITLYEFSFINYEPENIWTLVKSNVEINWGNNNHPKPNVWILDYFNPNNTNKFYKICRYYSDIKNIDIVPPHDASTENNL